MAVLLLTLGKGRKDAGNRYQKTKYRFKNGFEHDTAFFGIALHHWLKDAGTEVDQVIILGTSGSSWDALLEEDPDQADHYESLYFQIGQAAEHNQVQQPLLQKIEEPVSAVFKTRVHCHLIDDASTTDGQFDILHAIANTVSDGAELHIDITHGYRHLPLLKLLSAQNLEEATNATIKGIYYGMFEKKATDGSVPAVELSFASELSQWTRAMHAVRFGRLSALLTLPGMEPFQDDLKKLIVFEQMNQVTNARKFANDLYQALRDATFTCPVADLFRDALLDQFSWGKEGTLAVRQLRNAERAIEQLDYIRGIILLNEALITKAIPAGKDVMNIEMRLNTQYCETEDHYLLRSLRNVMAHGTRPTGKNAGTVTALTADPIKFEAEILRLLDVVRKDIDT